MGSAGLRDANPQTRLGNSHARALRQGTRGVPLDKAIWGMSRVEPNLVAGVVGCPNRLGTVHPNLGEYGQLHCPGSPTVARAACAWASARYLYPAPSRRQWGLEQSREKTPYLKYKRVFVKKTRFSQGSITLPPE